MIEEMDEVARLAAARAGDQEAFESLTDPVRRELLIHCYRMLGSYEDAEDILQETLLRAWRRLNTFEGRSTLRAWLYKIATNAALDALDGRRVRLMPAKAYTPSRPGDPLPAPVQEAYWIEPLPDTLIDERPVGNPETRYETRESVTFAFLAALQNLPGRQRAVLILRDVLGWNSSETAEILDTSIASVNSALQRARATLKQRGGHARAFTDDELTRTLLSRYVQAWEAADSTQLVALLREDAALTMPPLPVWYRGHEAIHWFLDTHLFADPAKGHFRLVPTRANSAPAFAVYQFRAGAYRASALHVLTLEDGFIAEINDFIDERLFPHFGLSAEL